MIHSPLLNSFQGFIDGRWCDADSGRVFDVNNPATGVLLARVPLMDCRETTRAIASAEAFLQQGASRSQRESWLSDIAKKIAENREELGRIITCEHGKPLKEAVAECDYAASFFEFYATQLGHLEERLLSQFPRNHWWRVFSRPAGVAALITPWNFPIAMLAKKLSAAMAAGCSSVIKPSSKTPLTVIALMTILDELKLPAGLINLVTGPAAAISECLCQDSRVRVVSFTGSTEIGRTLMSQSAGELKRLSLELGGNAPFIVFDDADLNSAADHLIQNKFRASGQTCVCANRVYVQRAAEEEFVNMVVERVGQLKIGNGLEPDVDIGPLIDKRALEKVKSHVDDAIHKGARIVAGNPEMPSSPQGDFGCFFEPVVLTNVRPEMRCVHEETFGPIIPILSFDNDEEVIAAANATEYGLAAYVFTADSERGDRVIGALKFGHVGFNSGTGPAAVAPFGGFKQSGFGREGGVEGLHDFIEYQTVASPRS